MAGYGQFCPVAKAMEILDERWTLLVVRELLAGSTHFNELRRGNPRMSPALLSKRLHSLERAGLVRKIERQGRLRFDLDDVAIRAARWWLVVQGDEVDVCDSDRATRWQRWCAAACAPSSRCGAVTSAGPGRWARRGSRCPDRARRCVACPHG